MPDDQTTAFRSAHDAWLWTMTALIARRRGDAEPAGPCSPDAVIRCLDQLYRRHRIDIAHARVMRIWGERGIAPTDGAEAQLWRQAMVCLDRPLRAAGIVT